MAETYGTFVVVFLAMVTYNSLISTNQSLALIASAFAYGGSYTAMHYTLSHISGAHFNPIVTIAATYDRRLTTKQMTNYIVAQIFGAFAAALMIVWMTRTISMFPYEVLGYGNLSPFQTPGSLAFVVEMFTGFFLVYVYLAVSQRRLASWTGVSIGLMMTMIVLATGFLTGGHANPARSIASLFFMGTIGRQQLVVLSFAPIIGGLLARLFYKYLKYEDRHDVA